MAKKKIKSGKRTKQEIKDLRVLVSRIHTTIDILVRYNNRPVSFEEICKGINRVKTVTKDFCFNEIVEAMDEVHPKMWFTDLAWKPKGETDG